MGSSSSQVASNLLSFNSGPLQASSTLLFSIYWYTIKYLFIGISTFIYCIILTISLSPLLQLSPITNFCSLHLILGFLYFLFYWNRFKYAFKIHVVDSNFLCTSFKDCGRACAWCICLRRMHLAQVCLVRMRLMRVRLTRIRLAFLRCSPLVITKCYKFSFFYYYFDKVKVIRTYTTIELKHQWRKQYRRTIKNISFTAGNLRMWQVSNFWCMWT